MWLAPQISDFFGSLLLYTDPIRVILNSLVVKLSGDDINSEPSKAHNSIRQYVEQNHLLLDGERIGSSTIYPLGSALVVIHGKWVVVMEILYRKQNSLVISMNAKIHKRQVRNSGIINPNTFTRDNEPKFMDDNPDSALNAHNNFDRVNLLLASNERVKFGIDEVEIPEALVEISRFASVGVDDFLGNI